MSKELRDLLLIMDVPDPYNSIFSSSDHQFTVGRNRRAHYFIEVAFVVLIPPIASEE